eukprot:snap_masked-scaffold_28-processed-gene-4.54-mRNA-1 protein AED:1.00 eAED:1.00 QI:0/-1/0/0/-1/1/1/0/59
MNIDLPKSVTELILEGSSRGDPILFAIFKQNFNVEKAELTKKAHVFKLPCKRCSRKMTW